MTEAQQTPSNPPIAAPPFKPGALAWQLGVDAAMRTVVLLGVIVAAAFVLVYDGAAGVWVSLAILGVFVTWLAMGMASASVTRRMAQVTALTETDPAQAEAIIAADLRRKALLRWVRLMLYYRLAVLRHRQHRYAEAAAICAAVLARPLGPGRGARPHLLLMLAESMLQLSNPAGAWPALMELYTTRLSLMEAIQRLALQTRYEVVTGNYAAALQAAEKKIAVAELMPAPQCGAMHAMLAAAARADNRHGVANWLWRRAELLCSPEQLAALVRGGFGISVVEAAPAPPLNVGGG